MPRLGHVGMKQAGALGGRSPTIECRTGEAMGTAMRAS